MKWKACISAGAEGSTRANYASMCQIALAVLTLREASDLDVLITKGITIETRRPQIGVATDGELNQMNTPLNYLIHPGALQVIAPVINVPGSSA